MRARRDLLGRLLVGLTIAAVGCSQARPQGEVEPRLEISDGWLAMGTFFEADLRVPPRDRQAAAAWLDWARGETARLERIYSRHDPSSELSALNRALAVEDALRFGARVDAELEALLFASLGVWEASGGAFDVTVGPLVDVWAEAAEGGAWPELATLRRAKRRVGGERLLMPGDGEIGITVSGLRIDLDGIAKGAALDRLREVFVARLPDATALLSFGQSSVVAIGAPDEGPGWRLVVESRAPGGGTLGTVLLRDRALSVSSSVGSLRSIGDQTISHAIDPRTGAAVEGTVEAIVVAQAAARADAWSTALLVLGAQPASLQLVEKAGIEAFVFETGGRAAATRGWERAVSGAGARAGDDDR